MNARGFGGPALSGPVLGCIICIAAFVAAVGAVWLLGLAFGYGIKLALQFV